MLVRSGGDPGKGLGQTPAQQQVPMRAGVGVFVRPPPVTVKRCRGDHPATGYCERVFKGSI